MDGPKFTIEIFSTSNYLAFLAKNALPSPSSG